MYRLLWRQIVILPVALDFLTALLDVSEAAAGVALLLVGVVAVPRHVTRLATVVAHLLSLLLGLLAVPGDVSGTATVVAGCRDDSRWKHTWALRLRRVNLPLPCLRTCLQWDCVALGSRSHSNMLGVWLSETAPPTVCVLTVLGPLAVSGHMSELSAAVAEQVWSMAGEQALPVISLHNKSIHSEEFGFCDLKQNQTRHLCLCLALFHALAHHSDSSSPSDRCGHSQSTRYCSSPRRRLESQAEITWRWKSDLNMTHLITVTIRVTI